MTGEGLRLSSCGMTRRCPLIDTTLAINTLHKRYYIVFIYIEYIMNQIEQAFERRNTRASDRPEEEKTNPVNPFEISLWRWTITITETGP